MNPLASRSPAPSSRREGTSVEDAVLRTVAYGDIFDFPLTVPEIHRSLVGVTASQQAVEAAMAKLVPDRLGRRDGYVFLPGREDVVATRLQRRERARTLWPRAREYGSRIASLPFVRMVAVTGSLARSSVDEHADVDLLVVTEPGRLWICRAMVGLLTRRAAGRGVTLCANYFLTEDALALGERNVYTAHELLQMVPLAGHSTYRRLLEANGWTREYFPNHDLGPAASFPDEGSEGGGASDPARVPPGWVRSLLEGLFRLPPGAWLDALERRRKLRKSLRQGRNLTEARFDPSCFKGHFDGHGRRTLTAYEDRLRGLEQGAP